MGNPLALEAVENFLLVGKRRKQESIREHEVGNTNRRFRILQEG